MLSGKRDSNPRPPAWKASALSTELFPQLPRLGIFVWVRMDSNHRSRRQQIYSLPHLATLEHTLRRNPLATTTLLRSLYSCRDSSSQTHKFRYSQLLILTLFRFSKIYFFEPLVGLEPTTAGLQI